MAIISASGKEHQDLALLVSRLLTYGHGWAYSEHMNYLGVVETQARQLMVFDTNIRRSDITFHSILVGKSGLIEMDEIGAYPIYISNYFNGDETHRADIDIWMPHAIFSGTTQHGRSGHDAEFDGRIYVCTDVVFMRDLGHEEILALAALAPDPLKEVKVSVDTQSVHGLTRNGDGVRQISTPEQILLNGILELAPAADTIPQPLMDLIARFGVDINRTSAANPCNTLIAQAIKERQGCTGSDVKQFIHQLQVPLSQPSLDACLHASVANHAYELSQHLISLGASIHSRNRNGMTLMMTAAANDHTVALLELINAGVDPSLVDDDGNGVLHYLAQNYSGSFHTKESGEVISSIDLVHQMVERGAPCGENRAGETPFDVGNIFGPKLQDCFYEALEPLLTKLRLERNADDIPVADDNSRQRIRM